MSAGDTVTFLMVGLPESGKSTYLAALYHFVRNASSTPLKLLDLPDERDYLIEIERAWLRLEEFERSRLPAPKPVSLDLAHRGSEFTLSIPDIKGETYSHLWELGSWTSEEAESIATNAAGILLFAPADRIVSPSLIDVSAKPKKGSKPVPWSPDMAPTQTQLCDVLETLLQDRNGELPPVAVTVSAWDTEAESELRPSTWLELRMPLLWQWLRTNSVNYQVFGVSAQGGDLSNTKEKKRLADLQNPVDRITNVSGCDALIDPLVWLLEP